MFSSSAARSARRFPGVTFYTLPVDMVTQILNFGLPAPINIQIVGHEPLRQPRLRRAAAQQDQDTSPGTADLRIQQPFDNPQLMIDVDRTKAQQIGFTAADVASSLLTATSGSFQTSPSFWLDPNNGVSYSIAVQSPQYSARHACRTCRTSRSRPAAQQPRCPSAIVLRR